MRTAALVPGLACGELLGKGPRRRPPRAAGFSHTRPGRGVPSHPWSSASCSLRRAAFAPAWSARSRPSSCARALRRAGLRPASDRPQPTRRSRPRGTRGDLRGERKRGARGRHHRLLRARRRAVGVRALGRARPEHDRRHLSAGDEGARPGPPLRGRGIHGRARSATPVTRRSSGRWARRRTRSCSSSRSTTSRASVPAGREARVHHADDAVGRRDAEIITALRAAFRTSAARSARTSVTRRPTGSGR